MRIHLLHVIALCTKYGAGMCVKAHAAMEENKRLEEGMLGRGREGGKRTEERGRRMEEGGWGKA